MLKNLKKALNGTKTKQAVRGNEKDLVSEKRRKQKEKEAKLNGQNNERPALIAATKDGRPVILVNSKALGSKKLASVVSRLRLITLNKRKNVSATSGDGGHYGQEYSEFKTMIEQQDQLQLANNYAYNRNCYADDTDTDNDDNLSYYSAMAHFEDCTCQDGHELVAKYDNKSETQQDAERCDGRVEAEFNEYLDEGKFILPEEKCDIPTFLHTSNCNRQLIDETRRLLRERYQANPDSFFDDDYQRMLTDDWTVTRFLLRRRLDPKRTAKLMEECGKFRIQHKMGQVELKEFPREFHKAGGLFAYEPDRVGNMTLYMRVKMYRRVPEISDVFKAWILCALEQCDVANQGRGTAVIFDLSSCGLQNIDLGFLYWLLSSFRNYCPKGVSYILVYNLPWFMSATCKLAMTWLSETNRRALRFVQGKEIENFIAPENLPDYLGGTCKTNYRRVPPGSKLATEVCGQLQMTPEQALKIKDLFKEYLDKDDDDECEDGDGERAACNAEDCMSNYGDAKALSDKHERISCHSSIISSTASTALISENSANDQLRDCSDISDVGARDPLAQSLVSNSSSQDTLVPVVNLVTRASKFIAQ